MVTHANMCEQVRKSPKAMAELKKQVKYTKAILCANTMEPISVKSLRDDRDFRSSITCQKFEELYELKHSGLKMDEIYAVELIG
ncbi:hypothetical protein KPL71_020847 [Citrus sinensis]|uniref:Uncharacterized protein n=1 Tax=Citrus sinensis TaxID=2711 RepID=A0ACB8JBM9_CITSI|nr:hypothetical protein KPL71_020847 [Citrus sinensis]